MPITTTKRPFTDQGIALAPNEKGAYALYRSGAVTYYGKSDVSICARLMAHKRGDHGACTQNADQYNCELAANPVQFELDATGTIKSIAGIRLHLTYMNQCNKS